MSEKKIPKSFITLIEKISNKRARIVIDHIIKHGKISTEELENDYGYNHPPRAARDVREAGIPLKTIRVKSKDGKRNIAAYEFGDFDSVRQDRIQGRINWPKNFKQELIEFYGSKCIISGAELEPRSLQIDHRIPYQIVGDDPNSIKLDVENFMLLSSTSNRAKSWSCEHCKNWNELQNTNICKSCYWAFPEEYTHVAMKEIRRIDITWQEEEVSDFEKLKENSDNYDTDLPTYIKKILKDNLKE